MDGFLEAFQPVVVIAGWFTILSFVGLIVLAVVASITDAVRDAQRDRARYEQAERDRRLLLEWEAADRG